MAFNRTYLHYPHFASGQELTWGNFPDDLCEMVLTFLSDKELSKIKRVNRRMRTFVDLAVHFNRCWHHPQHLQKNSLSQHLINTLMQNPSLKDDEGLGKIQAYFNEKFGQHTVNLLADYETLRNQLFIPRGSGPRWIDNQKVVEEHFYPFITSSMWVRTRCQNLFSLAKKIKDVYRTVLSNQQERKKGEISESSVTLLPPSLPIQSYTCLHNFLKIAHAVEGFWSNVALLNSIISGPDRETIRHQNQNIDSIITNTFRNLKLTENITSSAILYLRNLRPYFFSTHLLIDNPHLFSHFNRLTTEELIFAVHYDSAALPDNSSFLKKVIGKEEIRKRLKSHHYVQLAYSPINKFIGFSEAAAILSVAEVIAELTDHDLLVLLDRGVEKIPALLQENPALKRRMTKDLWFEFAKNFGESKSTFVSTNKAIYDLLSVDQLKHLIMKDYEYHLLLDDDVCFKLQHAFTIEEISYLKLGRTYECKRIVMLEEKDNIKKLDEETLYLKEKAGNLKAFWVEGGVQTTRILRPEASKKLRFEFAQKKSIKKDYRDAREEQLFYELISLCDYTSKIGERITQLIPRESWHDWPDTADYSSAYYSNVSCHHALHQGSSVASSINSVNTKTELSTTAAPVISISEHQVKPLEKKPEPIFLYPDKQPKCMETTLTIASTLIVAGTGLGISAMFMPHLLTAAIAVLGSGLLVLSAYGVMKCSQQGFFSSRSPTSTVYRQQFQEPSSWLSNNNITERSGSHGI